MSWLRSDAKYEISIPLLVNCRKDNIVLQSLKTRSLNLHYNDVMANPNLMASNILCLNETQISSLHANLDLHALLLQKFNTLSYYDGHGTIMLYHTNMTLFKSCTFTHFGAKFIMSSFNENTSQAMNIIATYKPPKMQLCHYLGVLKNILTPKGPRVFWCKTTQSYPLLKKEHVIIYWQVFS
jgi:hypothetical protein